MLVANDVADSYPPASDRGASFFTRLLVPTPRSLRPIGMISNLYNVAFNIIQPVFQTVSFLRCSENG